LLRRPLLQLLLPDTLLALIAVVLLVEVPLVVVVAKAREAVAEIIVDVDPALADALTANRANSSRRFLSWPASRV
jgi:hypothetical protein